MRPTAAAFDLFEDGLKRFERYAYLDFKTGLQSGTVKGVPDRLQRHGVSYLAVERERQQALHERVSGLL